MLLRSLLRPFIFIEVMSEGAVLPDLPVEQCLEGLLILLVAHASNDCIPSGHEILQVFVDELNRKQILDIINSTILDVRAEMFGNHVENLSASRVSLLLSLLVFEDVDLPPSKMFVQTLRQDE